jgi:hypothetical protein
VGSPNPFEPGKDPMFDAWLASYDYGRKSANDDATLRRSRAQQEYGTTLGSIADQQERSGRNLQTGLLSRGVFRSGEANRRRADLEATGLKARSAADTAYTNTQGQITDDYTRSLATLDLQREQQIAASRGRVAESEHAAAERQRQMDELNAKLAEIQAAAAPPAPAPAPLAAPKKKAAAKKVAAPAAPKPVFPADLSGVDLTWMGIG